MPRPPGLMLHAAMESAEEVASPTYSTELTSGSAFALRGSGSMVYEAGVRGSAAHPTLATTGPGDYAQMIFAPGNFDFADADDDGAKLELWLKFNENPHLLTHAKFLAYSGPYGQRVFSAEIYGSIPYMIFEFYGGRAKRFYVYCGTKWPLWNDWKPGDWHKVTLTWKRNGAPGNAELHLFIDDSQEGCPKDHCNRYGGTLPQPGTWTDFRIGARDGRFYSDFAIDELWSFSTARMPPAPLHDRDGARIGVDRVRSGSLAAR